LPPLVVTKIIRLGDAPIRTSPYTAVVFGASDRRTQKKLVAMSRSLAALASVLLTVLGLVVLLPDCASACSCSGGGGGYSQKQIVEYALSDFGAVFSGEVVDIEEGPPVRMMGSRLPSSRVTLRVFEVWKGPQPETLEVSTPSDGVICGYPFK
jgi:hypothetical protein